METERRLKLASLTLRFGLMLVFLYAAVASFVSPDDWIGYLPPLVRQLAPAEVLLKLFSAFELALALWLISGRYVVGAAGLTAATMVAIVLSDLGLFAITFRDLGLAAAALALAVLEYRPRARNPLSRSTAS